MKFRKFKNSKNFKFYKFWKQKIQIFFKRMALIGWARRKLFKWMQIINNWTQIQQKWAPPIALWNLSPVQVISQWLSGNLEFSFKHKLIFVIKTLLVFLISLFLFLCNFFCCQIYFNKKKKKNYPRLVEEASKDTFTP